MNTIFQSTLPAGGATLTISGLEIDAKISIHAPRGGSDEKMKLIIKDNVYISIHAPRGGSDSGMVYHIQDIVYFNPRSPRGERLQH